MVGRGKRKNKNNIRTFSLVFSSPFCSLTVVVHNVNGVLVFGEADGTAAGQAQQRHQGTEHGEPHGWGQVTALLNYLKQGHGGEAAAALDTDTTSCCTRGVLFGFEHWQQGTLMGNCCVTQPRSKLL